MRFPLTPTLSPSDGATEELAVDCVPTNNFGMRPGCRTKKLQDWQELNLLRFHLFFSGFIV